MISRSTASMASIYNALEPLPRLFNSFDERLSDDIEIPGEIFREFFWLFEPRGKDVFSDPSFEATQRLRGSFGQSQALFERTKPRFASYEEFLSELEKRSRH